MIIDIGTFKTDKNLIQLGINVEYSRLGDQDLDFSVNYGTSPATVTITDKSIFECNGNRYQANGNEVFQLDNASHTYITFTKTESSYSFGSSATRGTYSIKKNGYYVNNTTKVFDIYIDQSGETILNLLDSKPFFEIPYTKKFDRVLAKITSDTSWSTSAVVTFDNEIFDTLGNYDNTTYTFTVAEYGIYLVMGQILVNPTAVDAFAYLRKNGATYNDMSGPIHTAGSILTTCSIIPLSTGDNMDIYLSMSAGTLYGGNESYFSIQRIL